jgi:hypothetical protein
MFYAAKSGLNASAQKLLPLGLELPSRRFSCQRVAHDSGWNSNRSLKMISSQHVYEIRPRKDRRGLDLISDRLPLGLLWFEGPDAFVDAVNYAKFYSPSHAIIIRLFDESGNVIETHEHKGDFKEW